MIVNTQDWRRYRTRPQLALTDDIERRLLAKLGNAERRFYLVTVSPHRSESRHLSDRDRQYASAKCGAVHKQLTDRCIRLYNGWNKLFFRFPSARIGNHFPTLICIDDPVAITGGAIHEESNGPHAHIVMGIQAKHVAQWQRMLKAGNLQADAEKLFPRGKLHVEEVPESDVAETISYSLKYEFQVVGNEPLWHFFWE